MDPDTTLAELRTLVDAILDGRPDADPAALAEHVQTLDAWLSRGGYLPAQWAR